MTLSELLEIENDVLFAHLSCPATQVLVWPAIRNIFFEMLISDLHYKTRALVDTERKLPLRRHARLAFRAAVHNALQRPRPSSVLIYATGGGLYEVDGRSRNRYTHGFREVLGTDHWALEGLIGDEWPLPREGGRLSFSLPGLAMLELRARIRVSAEARRIAGELVAHVAQRAEALLGWQLGSARREWLASYCARKLSSYPARRRWVLRWLAKVRPRLLLVEEGCYGHMAVLNRAARERGVPIAEFQHGTVSAGHAVYNVAPALAESADYRRTLPDYFLAYGAWWSRQLDLPVTKVVIGNPHRERIAELERAASDEERIILVLGDGAETDAYLELSRRLDAMLAPGQRVVFRPHPAERSRVAELLTRGSLGLDVDRGSDILPSLARADAVVAELSTGLFEAVGLARRVFVWNTSKSRFSLPEHPFSAFETVEELAAAITGGAASGLGPETGVQEIWAPDWRRRFRRFLDQVLEEPSAG